MDYCELNRYIESKLGQDTTVCQEKLRELRRQDTAASLLDGISSGPYKQGSATIPDCEVQRLTVCDDKDGVWSERCTQDHVENCWRSSVSGC